MIDNKLIAVLDDEIDILELISVNLKMSGFIPVTFNLSNQLFEFLNDNSSFPSLIIIDVMLPDKDGFEILKDLKQSENFRNIPVIMLTAKNDLIDKIVGLELGADDYITKPFSVKELIARIKIILKRVYRSNDQIVNIQNIQSETIFIDKDKHEVFVNQIKIDLTLVEFKILDLLMSKKNNVFSREKILYYLWGDDKYVIDRTIDVHIRNLRMKLGEQSIKIQNIRGLGYKFAE